MNKLHRVFMFFRLLLLILTSSLLLKRCVLLHERNAAFAPVCRGGIIPIEGLPDAECLEAANWKALMKRFEVYWLLCCIHCHLRGGKCVFVWKCHSGYYTLLCLYKRCEFRCHWTQGGGCSIGCLSAAFSFSFRFCLHTTSTPSHRTAHTHTHSQETERYRPPPPSQPHYTQTQRANRG